MVRGLTLTSEWSTSRILLKKKLRAPHGVLGRAGPDGPAFGLVNWSGGPRPITASEASAREYMLVVKLLSRVRPKLTLGDCRGDGVSGSGFAVAAWRSAA